MNKEKKKVFIDEMRSISNGYSSLILISMEALKAADFVNLRSDLWAIDASMKVVKNSLLKIVLGEGGYESLVGNLNKQTAVLYSDDIVSLSKLLYAFMKTNSKVSVIGFVYHQEVFDSAKIEKFAMLPSLVELQAQIFGILKHGVARKLVSVLDGAKRRVPDMLKAHANS